MLDLLRFITIIILSVIAVSMIIAAPVVALHFTSTIIQLLILIAGVSIMAGIFKLNQLII